MEELSDITFLVVIEGQDYERSLRKIVSGILSLISAKIQDLNRGSRIQTDHN